MDHISLLTYVYTGRSINCDCSQLMQPVLLYSPSYQGLLCLPFHLHVLVSFLYSITFDWVFTVYVYARNDTCMCHIQNTGNTQQGVARGHVMLIEIPAVRPWSRIENSNY